MTHPKQPPYEWSLTPRVTEPPHIVKITSMKVANPLLYDPREGATCYEMEGVDPAGQRWAWYEVHKYYEGAHGRIYYESTDSAGWRNLDAPKIVFPNNAIIFADTTDDYHTYKATPRNTVEVRSQGGKITGATFNLGDVTPTPPDAEGEDDE